MRFLGNIEAKTDAKGRVFLPATFRKVLQMAGEDVLVMRKDVHQQCLVLYPESTWNRRMDALLERVNEWDDVGQQVLRQYVSEAEVLTLDGNGRFLIPKRYLQMADIVQGVGVRLYLFHGVGLGRYFDIPHSIRPMGNERVMDGHHLCFHHLLSLAPPKEGNNDDGDERHEKHPDYAVLSLIVHNHISFMSNGSGFFASSSKISLTLSMSGESPLFNASAIFSIWAASLSALEMSEWIFSSAFSRTERNSTTHQKMPMTRVTKGIPQAISHPRIKYNLPICIIKSTMEAIIMPPS